MQKEAHWQMQHVHEGPAPPQKRSVYLTTHILFLLNLRTMWAVSMPII